MAELGRLFLSPLTQFQPVLWDSHQVEHADDMNHVGLVPDVFCSSRTVWISNAKIHMVPSHSRPEPMSG